MDPIILCLAIVLACIAVEKWRSKRRWSIDGVPIAPPVEHSFSPLWGHLGALYTLVRDSPGKTFDVAEAFCRRSRHKIVALYPGPPGIVEPIYFLLDPKEGRRVAANGHPSEVVGQALITLMGEPLISTAHFLEERQLQRRKKIMAASLLRPPRIQFMAKVACKQTGLVLASGWLDEDGGVFDGAARSFAPLMNAITLENFLSLELPPAALDEYTRNLVTMTVGMRDMLAMPINPRYYPYLFPLAHRRCRAAFRSCRDDVVRPAVEQRVRDLAAGRSVPDDALTSYLNGNDDTDGDGGGGVAAMSVGTICSEITAILFASDTLVNTLLWFMLYIAHNPEVQEKCFDEVTSVIGESVELERPDTDDIARMPYLQGTIKETQRIAPISHAVLRSAHENLVIGDFVVPKGSHIIIPSYTEQMLAENYDEPEKLRPERWLEDPLSGGAKNGRKTLTYAPFGYGSHQCFGRTLALAEAKVICSVILQSYRVEPVSPLADAEPHLDTITYRPRVATVRFVRRPSATA